VVLGRSDAVNFSRKPGISRPVDFVDFRQKTAFLAKKWPIFGQKRPILLDFRKTEKHGFPQFRRAAP
jgi:hypothetical protein